MEGAAAVIRLPLPPRGEGDVVTFSRVELRTILNTYGRMVASGVWLDYAMSFQRDAATFAVFGRASIAPQYRIEKRPAYARRQGAFAVFAADGRLLVRDRKLETALRVFQPDAVPAAGGKVLPFRRLRRL